MEFFFFFVFAGNLYYGQSALGIGINRNRIALDIVLHSMNYHLLEGFYN